LAAERADPASSPIDCAKAHLTAGGLSAALLKVIRMRMQAIRAASDENDLRLMKSYRFEKLKGDRKVQCSTAARPLRPARLASLSPRWGRPPSFG
jgi:hypothetical protein